METNLPTPICQKSMLIYQRVPLRISSVFFFLPGNGKYAMYLNEHHWSSCMCSYLKFGMSIAMLNCCYDEHWWTIWKKKKQQPVSAGHSPCVLATHGMQVESQSEKLPQFIEFITFLLCCWWQPWFGGEHQHPHGFVWKCWVYSQWNSHFS